ncbi:MAG: O-acetyltransferase OatA [Alphaproteobacteria bacterium ADurb.BinA280]|jgi:peptidoglycan/LPS O-acetylase OafA/YrhL|nr:MAG: O-acetyltransferase OatA [Alphaproteobacteria bacterium ADurb.BinA280]
MSATTQPIDPPTPGHLAAITGLRGVAALWVMLFHLYEFSHHADLRIGAVDVSGWLASGYLGVDLFFVLSGFLLAPAFIDLTRRRGLRTFWRHRFRRVLPALWAQIVILLLVAALWGPGLPSAVEIFTNLTLSFNLLQNSSSINPVYWSLPVEWNFYLLLPLLALGFRGSARRVSLTIAAWIAFSIGFRLLCVWAYGRYGTEALELARWIIQLPGRIDQFVIGMGAAWLSLQTRIDSRRGGLLAWAGALAALGLAALASHVGNFMGDLLQPWVWLFYPLIAVAFASLSLGVSSAPSGLIARLLSVRPLVWVGMISYSLYLWHLPFLQAFQHLFARPIGLTDSVLLSTVILLAAWLSFVWIERPFLPVRAASQHESRASGPA